MSEVQSVQWFPGHMAKTRRAIQSSLKLVDIVAELIDARIPVSSRNPVLKSIIGSKPKIVLMNKADMADPAQTAQWVEYFRQHKTTALPIDCKTGKGLNRLMPEIREYPARADRRVGAQGHDGQADPHHGCRRAERRQIVADQPPL